MEHHHHLLEVEGVHVSRREDLRLITGTGKYASDWNLPGQLYACFVRADRAHAKILSLDTQAAARHPGVVRIYTGEDTLRAGYVRPMTMLTFKGKGGMELKLPERPALAHGRVRCIGEFQRSQTELGKVTRLEDRIEELEDELRTLSDSRLVRLGRALRPPRSHGA